MVCDGVSSAPRPDEASLCAVRAAAGSLLPAVRAGDDPAAASAAAVRAAGRAVGELAGPAGAPAATYASAVVDRTSVTVCWLGDSRVYWLAADVSGSRCLTTDDSLAEELVGAGLATVDEAMASPQAHVITRWLGADLPEPEPHVARFEPPDRGVVLLCSDGLWNYQPAAAELAAHGAARRADRSARRGRRAGEVRARRGRRRQHHDRTHAVPASVAGDFTEE